MHAEANAQTTHTTDMDKRTAILQATFDLVAERGFHQTPMSLVAKRSGVSAGIIYHYFDNKEDLIRQLYWHIKAATQRCPPGRAHRSICPGRTTCAASG